MPRYEDATQFWEIVQAGAPLTSRSGKAATMPPTDVLPAAPSSTFKRANALI